MRRGRSSSPRRTAIQLGRAAGTVSNPFVEGLERVELRHLAAEVPLVEAPAEDRLVDALQLAEGELLRQQLKADRRVLQLVREALEGIGEDSLVIERQRRMLPSEHPLCVTRIRACHERRHSAGEQRVVRNRDHPAARIACRIAEGIELLEVDVPDARLLFELAARGIFERFPVANKPSRKRPASFERRHAATDEHHVERGLPKREDHGD